MVQIKAFRVYIDEQMKANDQALTEHDASRTDALKEIGNHLHESCIVSNDEVGVDENLNHN